MSKDKFRVSGWDKDKRATWQDVDAQSVAEAKEKATNIKEVVIVTRPGKPQGKDEATKKDK